MTKRKVQQFSQDPPPHYHVPSIAYSLIRQAERCGWGCRKNWFRTAPSHEWPEGQPFLLVEVRRYLEIWELPPGASSHWWRFTLMWRSAGEPPPKVVLHGGRARTPHRPGHHEAPSIRKIMSIIADNPREGFPIPPSYLPPDPDPEAVPIQCLPPTLTSEKSTD